MGNQKAPGQHEQINVDQNISKDRIKIVRQVRKDVTHLNCYIDINSKQYRVENISPFGVMLQVDSQITSSTLEGDLIVNNVDVGTIQLRHVRTHTDTNQITRSAYEVVGVPISIECIQALEDVQFVINELKNQQNQFKAVPDMFAKKIYEIKDWLEDIQCRVTEVEKKINRNDTLAATEYENSFVQAMGEYLNEVMPIKNTDLRGVLGEQDPETIKACYEFMREKLKQLIYQAPFSNRVFYKPLGYAGDYEMMNIIYQDNALGESLFAKCLHYYWIKQPAAQAVRNRAGYIKGKIEQLVQQRQGDHLHFLSVACGPAMEWQNILREGRMNDRPIQVTLLDQDETALIHAQRKMKEIQNQKQKSTIEFRYDNKAIRNIIARGLTEKYDMIYSAGLFDYFSDPVAQLAGQKLYEALKPGGKLIIGNFDVSNPNSIIMDSALDWRLLYRSADDLRNLFKGYGGTVTVEQEKLNINIFCVIEKP